MKKDELILLGTSNFLVLVFVILLTQLHYHQGDLSHLSTVSTKIFSALEKSGFWTACAGAFFGAAGGAWIIHSSDKRKQEKLDLSVLNRALAITASITTSLISYKRDHALPALNELNKIYDNYNTNEIEFQRTGQRHVLELEAQHVLSMASTPSLPSKDLLKALNQLSLAGPNTFLSVYMLDASATRLSDTIKKMNEQIQKIGNDPREPNEKVPYYLGLTPSNGVTDHLLPSLIEITVHEIDCCIFFTQRAQKYLFRIGNEKIASDLRSEITSLELIEEAKQYFPPDNYLEGYD